MAAKKIIFHGLPSDRLIFVHVHTFTSDTDSDLAKTKLLDIRAYNFKKLSALMKSCRSKNN